MDSVSERSARVSALELFFDLVFVFTIRQLNRRPIVAAARAAEGSRLEDGGPRPGMDLAVSKLEG